MTLANNSDKRIPAFPNHNTLLSSGQPPNGGGLGDFEGATVTPGSLKKHHSKQQREYAKARREAKRAQRERAAALPPKEPPCVTTAQKRWLIQLHGLDSLSYKGKILIGVSGRISAFFDSVSLELLAMTSLNSDELMGLAEYHGTDSFMTRESLFAAAESLGHKVFHESDFEEVA